MLLLAIASFPFRILVKYQGLHVQPWVSSDIIATHVSDALRAPLFEFKFSDLLFQFAAREPQTALLFQLLPTMGHNMQPCYLNAG